MEKYQKCQEYKYGRPEGFKHEKRDCTVKALSLSGNILYEDVHKTFKKYGRKDKHGVTARVIIQKVCKTLNLNAKSVKRSGSLKKFLLLFPKGNYFCLKRGHAFAVIDGVVHDENIMGSHIRGAWLITKLKSDIENKEINF